MFSKVKIELYKARPRKALICKVVRGLCSCENVLGLFPLFFGNHLWLICALNIILNSNFEPVFPPIILFIKIFVAEKVAKLLVGWCLVVVRYHSLKFLSICLGFLMYLQFDHLLSEKGFLQKECLTTLHILFLIHHASFAVQIVPRRQKNQLHYSVVALGIRLNMPVYHLYKNEIIRKQLPTCTC